MQFHGYQETNLLLKTQDALRSATATTDSAAKIEVKAEKEQDGIQVISVDDDSDSNSDVEGFSSSSSSGSSSSPSVIESAVHEDVRNAMYPLFFIHSPTNSATAGSSAGTAGRRTAKIARVDAACDSILVNDRKRIPLELEFIGTCFAVAPKIIVTTAHHYDARNDDVGRFGVLLPLPHAIAQSLRAQQEEGRPQKKAESEPKNAASASRRGHEKNSRVKQSVRATKLPMPSSSNTTTTATCAASAPTVIYRHEKLFLLVPCRYGAKAPTNMDWLRDANEGILPHVNSATAPQAHAEGDESAKGKGSQTKKKGDRKGISKTSKDAAVQPAAAAPSAPPPPPPPPPSSANPRVSSPDLAAFWLESPLPHWVSSSASVAGRYQSLTSCSPVEGTPVVTAYFEPPTVRYSAVAVGTHVRDRIGVLPSLHNGGDHNSNDNGDAPSHSWHTLFGRQLPFHRRSSTPSATTDVAMITPPLSSECILVAHKTRATAVMRSLVLAMRVTRQQAGIPPLRESAGEVIGGIACDGYFREAQAHHNEMTAVKASDASAAVEENATVMNVATEEEKRHTAAKLERRKRAAVVSLLDSEDEDDEEEGGDATRATNSGRDRVGPKAVIRSHQISVHVDDSSEDDGDDAQTHGRATKGKEGTAANVHFRDRFARVVPATFRPPNSFTHAYSSNNGSSPFYDNQRENHRSHYNHDGRGSGSGGLKRPREGGEYGAEDASPFGRNDSDDEFDEAFGLAQIEKMLREHDEAKAATATVNGGAEPTKPNSAISGASSLSPPPPASRPSPFPPLSMANSPVVWWHSCLTKNTVTPYGSSGGVVVSVASGGRQIVGMHVASNNLFTFYRYYKPRRERILRSLHVKEKMMALNIKLQSLKMIVAKTEGIGRKRESHDGEGPTSPLPISENQLALEAVQKEIAELSTALQRAPPISAMPPKGVEDGRISEFLTSRALMRALITMQIYLNPK